MGSCKTPTFLLCAMVALTFAITNYYVGHHDKTCVSNPLLSVNPHRNGTNATCSSSNGCVDMQSYLYVNASLLVFFVVLAILQAVCCHYAIRVLALINIVAIVLWSILGAYIFFDGPYTLCSTNIRYFLGISIASTFFSFPIIIICSMIMCGFSLGKSDDGIDA